MSERLLKPQEFCKAFVTWADAYGKELPTDSAATKQERTKFREYWGWIYIQIVKSSLLDRLIYQGEKLRTVPCPVHQGRWSGCVFEPLPCGCQNGANVTGWLPEPEDTGYHDDSALRCEVCGNPPKKQGLWQGSIRKGQTGHVECMKGET